MTLDDFTVGWLAQGMLRTPVFAYEQAGGNVGLTLYRDARFQVQLWALPPGAVVTEHRHPDIDTWLVRVAGKIKLRRNGAWRPLEDIERAEWMGQRTWKMRIAPGDWHEVSIGESGGAFLAISERIDGKPPTSVHLTWEGPALDEAHQDALGAG
jgi:hypothetical protein